MNLEPAIRRLLPFLRSVIPGDPWQLLFLAGTILLFLSPRLGWSAPALRADRVTADQRTQFLTFLPLFLWSIIAAGLVAYYSCFWSPPRPFRRIFLLIFLPALLGLGPILGLHFWIAAPARSVLDHRAWLVFASQWFAANLLQFSTGFYFAVAGLVLVATFTVRIYLGLSTLPLALPDSALQESDLSNPWPRYVLLTFIIVGPLFFFSGLSGLLTALPYILVGGALPSISLTVLKVVGATGDGVILIALVFAVLGKSGIRAARTWLRTVRPQWAGLALLLPAGISLVTACTGYLPERIHWAAYYFGKTAPPQFQTYFDASRLKDPWLIALICGAFAEEIVFRGLLLSRFIRRFGLHRGIFLTGLVWAAAHFRTDLYSGASVAGVFYHLAWRIVGCLAMNYVFAWMTLRWRSVIPAGIAHTVSNVLVISGVTGSVDWSLEYHLAAWVTVSIVLFRYWPPSEQEVREVGARAPDPVAVV